MEQPDGDTGDPLLFEFSSEPLTPAGTAPFRQPTFFETDVLLGLIKSGLVSSWEQLRAEQRDTDISGFGLDTVGDPFLLPTAFLHSDSSWVPAESSVHLVGSENFDDVNQVIEGAMEAFVEWQDSLGYLQNLGQPPPNLDEMEVNRQMNLAIFETGIRALIELRSEGLLEEVPNVVLNLWHMESEPTLEETISRCNPPNVAERYLADSRPK